jgi:voltage-gated potassium channel
MLNHPLRRIALALSLMSSVLMMGMLGFHWIEGWTLFDSFYMALTTLATVGYGEIHPLSHTGRIFCSILILTGVTVVFVSIGIMGDLIVQMELVDYFGRNRREKMFSTLSNHYIVCGAGRVGRSVVKELQRNGARIALIDKSPEAAAWGTEHGIPTLVADATEDEALRKVRIDTAKGLVAAMNSDAENVYVTLSAHVLNPRLLISARATDEQAEEKLRRAGATTVFTPYAFIGHRLAHSLLRPHVLSFLDVASAFRTETHFDLEIGQVRVSGSSEVASKTLEQCRIRQSYGVIVLAIKKQAGSMQFNPLGDTRVEAGDVLIALGERSKLKQMEVDLER